MTNLLGYLDHSRKQWKQRALEISFFVQKKTLYKINHPFPDVVVSKYYLEAGLCYITGLFVASTLASSASVEAAITRDPRMAQLKTPDRPMLTIEIVKQAKARGLPIDMLFLMGDNLDQDRVMFVDIRHKFAHGDLELSPGNKIAGPRLKIRKRKTKPIILIADRPASLARMQFHRAHAFLNELYGSQTPSKESGNN